MLYYVVTLQASRLALLIMNLKAASAIGCHSYVSFQVLHTQLNKILDSYLKQDHSTKSRKRGGASSQVLANSQDDDEEDNESVQFDFDFSQPSQTNRTRGNQQSSTMTKSYFKSFLDTFKETTLMIQYIKDEDQMLIYAQLYWRLLFLVVIHDEYKSKSDLLLPLLLPITLILTLILTLTITIRFYTFNERDCN